MITFTILDDKKELIKFLNKIIKLDGDKRKFDEVDLEKYNRKFITDKFGTRESDIIYKVKDRNVFILIEHQSTKDKTMPERITEYCVEIIRSAMKENVKGEKYPLIYPIVLYTGNTKWNIATSITENQEEYYGIKKLKYPKYNLIDINNFTKEDLVNDDSALSKVMLLERVKSKKEIEDALEILAKRKLNVDESKYIKIVLENSRFIMENLGKDYINKYIESLNRKGEKVMFEELFVELVKDKQREGEERGIREGRKKGIKEGEKQCLRQVALEMAKNNIKDEIIMKITKLNEKELEGIKQKI